jgi:hypothetical protein
MLKMIAFGPSRIVLARWPSGQKFSNIDKKINGHCRKASPPACLGAIPLYSLSCAF